MLDLRGDAEVGPLVVVLAGRGARQRIRYLCLWLFVVLEVAHGVRVVARVDLVAPGGSQG